MKQEKTSTLTVVLNSEETTQLQKIMTAMGEKTSTKTIKKLLSLYPRYLSLLNENKNLSNTINDKQKEIQSGKDELKCLKQEMQKYFDCVENVRREKEKMQKLIAE